MKVFIVTYNEYTPYEGTDTRIRRVFDSEEKAVAYIGNHSNELYEGYCSSYFDIREEDVE